MQIHVMPDFSPCPLITDEEVDNWLKYFNVPAPFTVLSVLISRCVTSDILILYSAGSVLFRCLTLDILVLYRKCSV